MHAIAMPRIDAAMQTGKIVKWLKKEDDKVVKGDLIVRVEGEKTTFEIEAPGPESSQGYCTQQGQKCL